MDSWHVESFADEIAAGEPKDAVLSVVINDPLSCCPVHAAIDVHARKAGFRELVGDAAGVGYRRSERNEGALTGKPCVMLHGVASNFWRVHKLRNFARDEFPGTQVESRSVDSRRRINFDSRERPSLHEFDN